MGVWGVIHLNFSTRKTCPAHGDGNDVFIVATPLVNLRPPWQWTLSYVAYRIRVQLTTMIGPYCLLAASVPAFTPECPQGYPALSGRLLVLVAFLAPRNLTSHTPPRTSVPIVAAEGCSPTGPRSTQVSPAWSRRWISKLIKGCSHVHLGLLRKVARSTGGAEDPHLVLDHADILGYSQSGS